MFHTSLPFSAARNTLLDQSFVGVTAIVASKGCGKAAITDAKGEMGALPQDTDVEMPHDSVTDSQIIFSFVRVSWGTTRLAFWRAIYSLAKFFKIQLERLVRLVEACRGL